MREIHGHGDHACGKRRRSLTQIRTQPLHASRFANGEPHQCRRAAGRHTDASGERFRAFSNARLPLESDIGRPAECLPATAATARRVRAASSSRPRDRWRGGCVPAGRLQCAWPEFRDPAGAPARTRWCGRRRRAAPRKVAAGCRPARHRRAWSRSQATIEPLSDLDDEVRVEPRVFCLFRSAGIPAWVAYDAALSNKVVEGVVHVAMNPQVRL